MTELASKVEQPVRVGMHALINPYGAGGSESSVMSIIDNVRSRNLGIDLRVFAIPSFAEKMVQRVGDPSAVVAMPYPEVGPVQIPPAGRIARLLDLTGPLRPLFHPIAARYIVWRTGWGPNTEGIRHFLKAQRVDVVHFGYGYNYATDLPFIYEPHDVQHKSHPEFFTPEELIWRDEVYTRGIESSAFVVCGTSWTKNNIVEKFGVRPEKIAVIPRYSVNARVQVGAERQRELAAKLKLPERYAYYPAMTFTHKNHVRLMEAMAILRDRHGEKLNLVCTGRPFRRHHGTLLETARRLKLEDQVKFLGPVPEDELVTVFERATMVVFPSLFEGLSQALLESLAFGKPIIAANQTSIPETVGEAALLFDGLDVESIVAALHRATTDAGAMQNIASKASSQLARFDWDRAALMLAACYKRAAGRALTASETQALTRATG